MDFDRWREEIIEDAREDSLIRRRLGALGVLSPLGALNCSVLFSVLILCLRPEKAGKSLIYMVGAVGFEPTTR